MKKLIYILIVGFLIFGCKTEIKNPNAEIKIEEGTEVELSQLVTKSVPKKVNNKVDSQQNNPLLGFWVGYFIDDTQNQTAIFVDEGYSWHRENKINISIDQINDSLVIGHSVVAGNDRPFKGTVQIENDGSFLFKVKEPGDDIYDGEFIFTIKEGQLKGKWTAYKDIEIYKRKYTLEKRNFVYNPHITLERSREYVNWHKVIETIEDEDMEDVYIEDDEFEEWVTREFASATDLIYEINASNTLLSKSEVENLKKGDLTIIRNMIYARHGYSFKNRPLRVFFDSQSWYIPVHTNIKDDFTELEKKNIQLLLRYEKNASEYYDSFGRG